MLNFVLGTSGVAKTKYLYDIMCKLAQGGNDKLMFIVPDQSSFETERAFLDLLGPKLCRNIKVFGFSRLADFVFEQTGNIYKSFADDGICHVVMNLAIEQVGDKLDLFKKRSVSSDLTDLMLNSVKEYKKCSITTDMLFSAADKVDNEVLSKKLYETALVYDAYEAIISNSYIDPSDRLTYVTDILNTTSLFDGYTIAVDSFYGFTRQEYDLLEVLLKASDNMYFALTTDNLDNANGDLFFATNRTKNRLVRLAKKIGVKVAKPTVFTENKRTSSPSLLALNANVFRIDKSEKPTDAVSDIRVFEAQSIYSEVDFVARNIRKLIVDEGYRYSDIAVITRSIDKYIGVLDAALDKYGISYFMDKPQNISTKPLFKFISSCFEFITGGFGKDDILSLLKTGLTDITVEQIADFENYLFTWDITGKRLFDTFTDNPRGFCDDFSESDKQKLDDIEHTRKIVAGALKDFYYDTKDTTGLGISKALMRLLSHLNCKENILSMCDQLEADGELELSKEQVRLYNTFVSILDKMISVIGDYSLSVKRFYELLAINFKNSDLSFIPRGIDQVDVAVADRSTLDSKKAVFIIGAVDGEFPHTPVESTMFNDIERAVLKNIDINMSDSVEELTMIEKYLAYKSLCCATDKLYISYNVCSLSGDLCTASSLVSESRVCVNVIEDDDVYVEPADRVWSQQSAFEFYTENYKTFNPQLRGLGEYFRQTDGYKDVLSTVDRVYDKQPLCIQDTNVAKDLFGTDMYLSASQVESFHMCKFEYFCKYGLNIRERRQAKIDALEYGTLMHFVLESFIKNHRSDDFHAITKDDISNEVSSILDSYLEKHLGGIENKTKRFVYLYYSMKSTAIALIAHICEELAQSDFKPVDFELNITKDIPAYTLELSDNISVNIRGSVDRVDIMDAGDTKYLRVIDYKTGTKHYGLSDVLYGLNLQMLIYMSAINTGGQSRYGATITPAGVLYMPAVSATVNNADGKNDDAIKTEKEKQYTMFGIVLNNDDVIQGMEQEHKGMYIPVSESSKLKYTLATLEEFGALFKKVDELITQMAMSLVNGDISAVPAKNKYDACEYCKYTAVCGYRDGDECHEVFDHSKSDMMSILMQGEVQADGE